MIATRTTQPYGKIAHVAVADEHDTVRSSVSKALELLEILVDNPDGEVSLSELSIQVGLPKSTVHRLVTELCQHGLAGRVGVKYCPGFKLAELSARSQWSEHRELLTVATPVLEWLFEQAGKTVNLGVLRGFDVVYLEKIAALAAAGFRRASARGCQHPAPASARRSSRRTDSPTCWSRVACEVRCRD